MLFPAETPKRALLQIRWQRSRYDNYVAELGPNNFACIHPGHIYLHDKITKQTDDPAAPQWLGPEVPFAHESIKQSDGGVITWSGYMACHALWPFDPKGDVDVLVRVDETDERYRIVTSNSGRLMVALSQVSYAHLDDAGRFAETIAVADSPRSDLFTGPRGNAN